MIDPKDPGTIELFDLNLFEWAGLALGQKYIVDIVRAREQEQREEAALLLSEASP